MPSGSDSQEITPYPEGRETLTLPEEMREELRRPLGLLIEGSPNETARRLGEIYSTLRPHMSASVGDFVSRNLLAHGLEPDIIVYDRRIMRREVENMELEDRVKIITRNRPGRIEREAWEALRRAVMLKRRAAVLVEGEEDLMVIPLILLMPLGSAIVYGQPNAGIVMVKVDREMKNWARNLISRMEKDGDEDEDDIG